MMANLQRAPENLDIEPRPASPQPPAEPPRGPFAQGVRPRIGGGPVATPRRGNARVDRAVALRALAISCAVAVVVLGGFYTLHSLGFGRTEEAGRDAAAPGASVAPAGLVPTTAAVAPADAAGEPEPPAPAPEPAPASAPAAPVPAGPTAEDFARPAFLEPMSADKADADATDDPTPEVATAAKPATEAADGTAAPTGENGRINTAINLRSAPQKGAAVLATLEAGTKVTVYSCKFWCEVAANGKRGYVYRRAVDQ
ncbi:SH3 domain-containing protein [Xanthobacter sp. V4C-4]|uniref:SH3 domain-containing protein n=1 Tax=Xanthobacter cornucopiae TaxID=3119924 RepID=UPI003727FF27